MVQLKMIKETHHFERLTFQLSMLGPHRVMECLTRVGPHDPKTMKNWTVTDMQALTKRNEHFQESFCETSWATQFFSGSFPGK